MSLSPAEKVQIRYHLGYLNSSFAGSIQFGLPRPTQTIFVLEQAMNLVIAGAEDKIRKIVCIMDGIECKLVDAQERLAASKLGEITLRADEPDRLEDEYVRWGGRLADTLGVPWYPYSIRYKGRSGVEAGSIPVRQ